MVEMEKEQPDVFCGYAVNAYIRGFTPVTEL